MSIEKKQIRSGEVPEEIEWGPEEKKQTLDDEIAKLLASKV